jgi:DNA-binding transcriptional LysR family regulator
MDIELARTFLVAVATGNFADAAQRLHVTQSTVSTRIQRLEEILAPSFSCATGPARR